MEQSGNRKSMEQKVEPLSGLDAAIAENRKRNEAVKLEIETWMKEDLARSGLTPNDIEVAAVMPKSGKKPHRGGYEIIFREPETGEEMLGLTGHPYRRTRYRGPFNSNGGGNKRYGTPYQAGNRCYFPPGVHEKLMTDSMHPLYLTEGEKKAAKASLCGLPTIGLTGIWNWLDSSPNRQTERGSTYMIHPDLTKYLTSPRDVYIIYDSDATENANKSRSFSQNTSRLAYELFKYDCPLFRIDLPPGEKNAKIGLDDYLVKQSLDELKKYIEKNAVPEPVRELSDVKRNDPYKEAITDEGRPFELKYNKLGKIVGASYNQNWNAAFMMQNHLIIYELTEDSFYQYVAKSGLWKKVSDNKMKAMLSQDLRDYWKDYHSSHVEDLLTYRTDMMFRESIKSLRGKIETEKAFDNASNGFVIHLPNGMLHLEDMTLRDFSPDYYSRNMIKFEMDEQAECPRFINELLYSALPEDDVDLLQRWAGTVIIGGNPSQQFMLIEGTAGGGKGTFAEILESIIGRENVAELRTHLLCERFEFAAFAGKSLLCGKDVPGNFLQIRGAEAIKKLTGHDYLDAEYKRVNQRSGVYGRFGMLITSNDRLKVRLDGDADAWRRRMMLVRYERPPVKRRIANFAMDLIRKEGKGILLWMISGAAKAMEDIKEHGKLSLNRRQQNLVDSLIFESDSITRFVKESLEIARGWDVTTEELKSAYIKYCDLNSWNNLSGRVVERQLPDLILQEYNVHKSNSLKRDDKSARGFRGLRIKGQNKI